MQATATRERPILFSGPMVRALLSGTKTQTRRVVKGVEDFDEVCIESGPAVPGHAMDCDCSTCRTETYPFWRFSRSDGGATQCQEIDCPFGRPGDRLWVRETWQPAPTVRPSADPLLVLYRATGDEGPKWRPSIRMPRWASRITLEVTDVRVERLQAISKADAKAEGVEGIPAHYPPPFDSDGYIAEFARLWDSINGKRPGCSWDANPFVWALTFRRLEGD